MTSSRVSILLGAVLGLAAISAPSVGHADGYYSPPSIKDTVAPPPPGRTWYFKGTLGMSSPEVGDLEYGPFATGNFDIVHKDMKTSPFYGLGIGIEHSRWLRFDLTGEYRGKYLFVGQDLYRNGACNGDATICGTNEYTADVSGWLGLANAYIDLWSFRGITPYVGGGVGLASLTVDGFKDVNVPANGVAYGSGDTSTNFAWALYAGVSYDVTPQLTVDLAYRYVDMGDAATGTVTTFDGNGSGPGMKINDVTSNDLMLNLRYRLEHPVAYVPVK